MSRSHGLAAHLHSAVIGGAAIFAIAAIGIARDFIVSTRPAKAAPILRVAVTRAAFADAVREIGRSRVKILPLAPYGNRVDDFALRTSDLLVFGGPRVDADVATAFSGGFAPRGSVVDASRDIAFLPDFPGWATDSAPSFAPPDANFWMDAGNAVRMAETIRDALSAADPAYAESYRENALDYVSRIREADAEYARDLRVCNARALVEGGDPHISYLARRHNLLYFAVRPYSSGEIPALAEYAAVTERHELKYVFRDTAEDPRIAESVARLTDASILPLESGSSMDSGSVAAFSLPESLHANLEQLVRGMDCRS